MIDEIARRRLMELADLCRVFAKARTAFLNEHRKDCHSNNCIEAYNTSEAIRTELMSGLDATLTAHPAVFEKLLRKAGETP